MLPELRLAFADLTPRECDHVAPVRRRAGRRCRGRRSLARGELEGFNEGDLLRGVASTVSVSNCCGKTAWRTTVADDADRLALLRWRLVLGKFSERNLGAGRDGAGGRPAMAQAGPGRVGPL